MTLKELIIYSEKNNLLGRKEDGSFYCHITTEIKKEFKGIDIGGMITRYNFTKEEVEEALNESN